MRHAARVVCVVQAWIVLIVTYHSWVLKQLQKLPGSLKVNPMSLAFDCTKSLVVGLEGTVVNVGGCKVVIPEGALDDDVTIHFSTSYNRDDGVVSIENVHYSQVLCYAFVVCYTKNAYLQFALFNVYFKNADNYCEQNKKKGKKALESFGLGLVFYPSRLCLHLDVLTPLCRFFIW